MKTEKLIERLTREASKLDFVSPSVELNAGVLWLVVEVSGIQELNGAPKRRTVGILGTPDQPLRYLLQSLQEIAERLG